VYQLHGLEEEHKTLNSKMSTLLGRVGMGLEYAMHRSGPLAMAPSVLGAFVCSSPEQTRPNLQFHVQPLSVESLTKFSDNFSSHTPLAELMGAVKTYGIGGGSVLDNFDASK